MRKKARMTFWTSCSGDNFFSISKITFAITREKYRGTMITFKSIADLQRDLQLYGTFSTLQLIKSYIDNNKNEKKNQVIYFLKN